MLREKSVFEICSLRRRPHNANGPPGSVVSVVDTHGRFSNLAQTPGGGNQPMASTHRSPILGNAILGNAIHSVVMFCLRMAQPEFFRRILVVGRPLDDPDEHLMVVANHPYGILDAFLVSLAYDRPFYFAATALNFQTRSGDQITKRRLRGWFLSQCKVLPIVRDRSEGHLSDNLKTFDRAAEHIAEGYALGTFAEGDSRGNQWKLLKLKAGSAQIALQVADILSRQGKKLKIQVVGLTYTNWDEPFKSTMTVKVAEPFVVESVDMNERLAVKAARKAITARMTELMEQLTVQIPDQHRDLVGKIARFYSVNNRNDYERLKVVGEKVEQLADQYADEREEIERKLDEYLALADELRIYPGEERIGRNKLPLLLVALPVYLGYVMHWPIIWATGKRVPRETTVLHALGSKRVTSGIGFTFLWYALVGGTAVTVAAGAWGLSGAAWALGGLLVMAGCGLLASRALRHVNLLVRSLLPSRRRFKRHRQLGAELYRRLEHFRHLSDDQPRAKPC